MAKRKNKEVCPITGLPERIFSGPDRPTVPEMLREAAAVYEERNKIYKDNYKHIGEVMCGMFPEGVTLKTVDDFNRFFCYFQAVGKLTRYAAQFNAGGHDDSLVDNSVYSTMLRELDNDAKANGTSVPRKMPHPLED